ncbi:hypothetical protein NDU88_004900 [Pleurodeles waltl]|uniref:Uncharacterized protein n=1 Tax=Pleurodeles waltl TaxID=8319 RepID=A0AAV7PL47_PLEWA|nr:hypothetical protein NDU88_004900 [Pleurodeles waltl]
MRRLGPLRASFGNETTNEEEKERQVGPRGGTPSEMEVMRDRHRALEPMVAMSKRTGEEAVKMVENNAIDTALSSNNSFSVHSDEHLPRVTPGTADELF